jgi:hypothetical protein
MGFRRAVFQFVIFVLITKSMHWNAKNESEKRGREARRMQSIIKLLTLILGDWPWCLSRISLSVIT